MALLTTLYSIKYGVARRFEHSVLNKNFSYLTDPDRPKEGPICPQSPYKVIMFLNGRSLTQSEDCLYLDIYLPPFLPNSTEPWPVLFWIYGGALKGTESSKFKIEKGNLTS